jgi:hypothetical protein
LQLKEHRLYGKGHKMLQIWLRLQLLSKQQLEKQDKKEQWQKQEKLISNQKCESLRESKKERPLKLQNLQDNKLN